MNWEVFVIAICFIGSGISFITSFVLLIGFDKGWLALEAAIVGTVLLAAGFGMAV